MDATELKTYIVDNNLVEDILSDIECHHIRSHGSYITCANKDGDNASAITVYLGDNLNVQNYTRQMVKQQRSTDIFDLICFNKNCTFSEAIKYVCSLFGLDYYSPTHDVPESIKILQLLKDMSVSGGLSEDDGIELVPIPSSVLNYYLRVGNPLFYKDNISYSTQVEFCIGYDPQTNYITIPIIDSIGNLVGVKGRYFGEPDEVHNKYMYLEKCKKSHILYGLYQNKNYIKNNNTLFVVEAEKGVLQSVSYGIRNVVACGGSHISKQQVELLVRSGCNICLAFDKDITEESIIKIANIFPDRFPVYAIIDSDDLLEGKQSPTDNPDVFQRLIKNYVKRIK